MITKKNIACGEERCVASQRTCCVQDYIEPSRYNWKDSTFIRRHVPFYDYILIIWLHQTQQFPSM